MRGTKLIPVALGALIAATMFAACSSGSTPTPAPASQAAASQAAPSQAPASVAPASPSPAPSVTAQGGTLTVWLMNGSLNDNSVVQLNTDFQMAHPGWKVNYQVQQWNGIVDKLTTAEFGVRGMQSGLLLPRQTPPSAGFPRQPGVLPAVRRGVRRMPLVVGVGSAGG